MKSLKIIPLLILIAQIAYAQVSITRNFNLELAEKDSLKSAILERSLNGFLSEALNNDYTEKYVDKVHLDKYNFFFRKLAGIGHDNESLKFNAPSILKSYTADGINYRITVAFTGEQDSVPFVFQVTELIAKPYKSHYRFYCPFEQNTATFKRTAINKVTYHHNRSLNYEKANEFSNFKELLADLTATPSDRLDYYCFESLDELLKSYGFLYSARQCNFLCYDLGFTDNNGLAYMTGTDNENYVFGFIGDYLYYNLPDQDKMYWPFVQGLSTYYGGYGLSYEGLDELKRQFREELDRNPDIDFLKEFKKGRKSSINRHFSYYVMSAFLCEKVLNEKDFKNVIKLVYSGKDGQKFFDNLNEVLGIDESNFHQNIVQIISKS